jgi:hypothetical protein
VSIPFSSSKRSSPAKEASPESAEVGHLALGSEPQERAKLLYLLLAALFITALVSTNLIANKFVNVDLGFASFVISAGILPYPLTFLVTDILSEIYGRRRTNQVVLAGFVSSLFVLFVLWLGSIFPAIDDSPVSNDAYDQVFGNTWRVIAASMVAYLSAQLIDVRLFHFWKNLTDGKHLWLRNNASTIVSQLVDTTLVILVLFVGQLPLAQLGSMIADGWMFKVMVALADTALIYLAVYYFRNLLRLKPGEEVAI